MKNIGRLIKPGDIIIIAAVLLLAALPAVIAGGAERGTVAYVYSDGKLIAALPLDTDAVLYVDSPYGSNTVQVRGGAVAVTDADCPGKDCVQRGWQSSAGSVIACVPHRLLVRLEGGGPDAVTG